MSSFEIDDFVGSFPVWLILLDHDRPLGGNELGLDRVLSLDSGNLKWAAIFTDYDLADRACDALKGRRARKVRVPDVAVMSLTLLALHSLRVYAGIVFDPDPGLFGREVDDLLRLGPFALNRVIEIFRGYVVACGE